MKRYSGIITYVVVLSLFFGVPAGFIYVLNNGNPYHEYLVSKHIPTHLKSQGYTKEEIEREAFVQPKHLINKDVHHGHYEVVFKDEPDISYYYAVTKWNHKVVQFCEKEKMSADRTLVSLEEKTKHSEKNCLDSYANRD